MGLAPNKGTKAVLLPRTSFTNAQVTCRHSTRCVVARFAVWGKPSAWE